MPDTSISELGPIDPKSLSNPSHDETEKAAPWIVRKLVGSMTGRIVISSYESLKAAGTSVVCLSPWGDSSPLLLPCIRFRDLAVHTVVAATGGFAAIASPIMSPISDLVITSFGDTILVEVGLHTGFEVSSKLAEDLFIEDPIKKVVGIYSKRLETTGIKVLLITLKFKLGGLEDARVGFFRSSVHKDASLFSTVMDYFSISKGWFSPYLFASSRRPIIPRSMKPDVVFCHGPFLQGDYQIGETLLRESAVVVPFAKEPEPQEEREERPSHHRSLKDLRDLKDLKIPTLSNVFARSRTPSPEPELAAVPPPPTPRRMVILVVGLKPHRKLWTTSARPGESVINYILLNGCPALVVPVKPGAPLVAWDALTLEQLWEVELLPEEGEKTASGKFEGIISVLFEFLDLCVDWEKVTLPEEDKRVKVRDAIELIVAAAIRSRESKEVRKEVDKERAGIAMWRIP